MTQDQTAETGDTDLTPETAVPTLEALLFPADLADPNESGEPAPEPEAPAEDDGAPDDPADAAEEAEDAEDAGESADAPETETQPPEPRRFRVKIADAEEEVTEEELVKGYQRQADYTRKTMALADERKAHEAELAAVRAERQQYAHLLKQLDEALQPESPPDWTTFQREHPAEFPAAFAAWQVQEQQRAAVKAERAKAEAQVAEDERKALAAMVAAERAKLLDAIPEWKDAEQAKTGTAQLASYLKTTYGFTDAEIAGTARHELLVMARKAMLYDQMQQTKPKIEQQVATKIKPAKPGSAAPRPKQTEVERAAARLAKHGRDEDLAKVLETFI